MYCAGPGHLIRLVMLESCLDQAPHADMPAGLTWQICMHASAQDLPAGLTCISPQPCSQQKPYNP